MGASLFQLLECPPPSPPPPLSVSVLENYGENSFYYPVKNQPKKLSFIMVRLYIRTFGDKTSKIMTAVDYITKDTSIVRTFFVFPVTDTRSHSRNMYALSKTYCNVFSSLYPDFSDVPGQVSLIWKK